MSTDQPLRGKVALVTGSTQGLGAGIAIQFAEAGAAVVINGRSKEKGEALTAKLRAEGARVKFIQADLSLKTAAQGLVDDSASWGGQLDILVNNAQIVPVLNFAQDDTNDAAIELAMRSGLYASLWTSQAALPHFTDAGGGRIVNFASINGVYGSKYGVAYNAARRRYAL